MPAFGRILKTALLCFGCLFSQAQSHSTSALRAALPTLEGKARLAALLELANNIEADSPQEALGFAVEGLALAIKEGDKEKEAACLSTAGFCCSQTGDFSKSIEYAKRSLNLGIETGNRDRVAKSHNVLGITYTFIGAHSQALEESLEALRIREELGQPAGIDQALNLVGVVYHHSGQYEKAIEYFNQILKRLEDHPTPKRLILTKLNTGFAQFKLGLLKEALKNHQEALALSREFHDSTYDAYAYLNLGLTYSDLRQFHEADRYLKLAYSEYIKPNRKHGLVQVLNAKARMYMLSGAFARGVPLAKEGAALAEKINARDELKTSYELISDLYEKLGNLKESYRYYKSAVAIKDSLFTIHESHKFAEASMKIINSKKDHEIEALKKEKLISDLKIEKQRYFSILLISSFFLLLTIVFILVRHTKKMRESRTVLKSTNTDLIRTNAELKDKINEIKTLNGLLPICAHCKKIRDDEGYWTQLEAYISANTSATFTHGICPHCVEELYPNVPGLTQRRASTPPAQS